MQRLHVHKYKVYIPASAEILSFEGVAVHGGDLKTPVRQKHIAQIFLYGQIIFNNYCLYHCRGLLSFSLSISANTGECNTRIPPPAASTLRRRDPRPPPSVTGPLGGSPSFVIMTL